MNIGKKQKQAGITLILSIFVLASVSILSFSVATLVLKEIKSSRRLINSEPAIIAAEAGGETVLYFRVRDLAQYNEPCPTSVTQSLPTGGTYASSVQTCTDYYDDPYYFLTASQGYLDGNEAVLLNDPTDDSNPAAGYTSVRMQAVSGTNGATLVTMSVYDLNDPDAGPVSTLTGAVGGSAVSAALDPAKSYVVFLDPGGSNRTASGTITITGTPPGVPSKNPAINATGSRNDLERKLEVRFRK